MKNYLTALFLFPFLLAAQTNVLQDKSGESSLNFGSKVITFNSGDASVSSSLLFNEVKKEKDNETFWGVNLKIKSNEGVAKLLDGNDFKPKFTLGFFRGRSLKSQSKSTFKNYYYSGEINNSYFKLLGSPETNTLNDKSFFGWRFKLGINKTSAVGKSPFVVGVSAEFGSYNNLDDLTTIDKYETSLVTTSTPPTIVLSKKKSGFTGSYDQAKMGKLNIDAIIYPSFLSSQFGIGGYFRGAAGGPFATQNLGVGIFVCQKKAPDKIVFGLVYQINDLFNQKGDEPSFQKRSGISLTAGYNF